VCADAAAVGRAEKVETEMKHDRYLSAHYRYYVREMRILAYTQLLESYRSLTLDYMARAFGVSVDFIDQSAAFFSSFCRLSPVYRSHVSIIAMLI